MKKQLLIIILLSLILPSIVLAQTPATAQTPAPGLQGYTQSAGEAAGFDVSIDPETGLAKILGIITRAFLSLLGIIFISYTLYGGWLWMTAAGNEEKLTKAKKVIQSGIIGLIIILSVGAIYLFIREALMVPSSTAAGGGS